MLQIAYIPNGLTPTLLQGDVWLAMARVRGHITHDVCILRASSAGSVFISSLPSSRKAALLPWRPMFRQSVACSCPGAMVELPLGRAVDRACSGFTPACWFQCFLSPLYLFYCGCSASMAPCSSPLRQLFPPLCVLYYLRFS